MNDDSVAGIEGEALDSDGGAGVGLAGGDVQGGHDSRPGTGALHELPDGALLDGPALALALGVCHRTLRRMIRRRELPPGVKLGAGNKWLAGRVRAWINTRAEQAEKEAAREAARLRAL